MKTRIALTTFCCVLASTLGADVWGQNWEHGGGGSGYVSGGYYASGGGGTTWEHGQGSGSGGPAAVYSSAGEYADGSYAQPTGTLWAHGQNSGRARMVQPQAVEPILPAAPDTMIAQVPDEGTTRSFSFEPGEGQEAAPESAMPPARTWQPTRRRCFFFGLFDD